MKNIYLFFLFGVYLVCSSTPQALLFAQATQPPAVPTNDQDYVPITGLGRMTEEFNSLGSQADITLPVGWKADKQSVARKTGTFEQALLTTDFSGGNNLPPTAAPGLYNFGAGEAQAATDRAIGFLAGANQTKSANLYVKLENVSGNSFSKFLLQYDIEKYRQGSNPAGFTVELYYSTNGQAWTSAGTAFTSQFAADPQNGGYAEAPGTTANISSILELPTPLAPEQHLYLAWNYSVSSGANTDNAQALAIDNFVLEVQDHIIELGFFHETEFCLTPTEGYEMYVSYTATGNFSGNNVFTVELSDPNGSFANPREIGALRSPFTGAIEVTLPAGLPSGNAYRIRIVSSGPQVTSNLSPPLIINLSEGGCSQPDHYFRSRQSGDWHTSTTWQTSADGTTWANSILVPTFEAKQITIQQDHIITTDADVVAERIHIEKGGTIHNRAGVFVISDDNMIVEGTFIFESDVMPALFAGVQVVVKEEGTIEARRGTENLAGIMAGNASEGKYIYESGGVFYWNINTPFEAAGQTFFPMATAQTVIPVFKIGKNIATALGGNATTQVNGLLEVNGNISWAGNSQKIFRNGVSGTGTITQNAGSGEFKITGTTAHIGGTGAIVLHAQGLEVSQNTILTLQSNKPVNAQANGVVNLLGTLDANVFGLQGSAGLNMKASATLITAHPQGFGGSLALNGRKTIEDGIDLVLNGQADQNLNSPAQLVIESLRINNPARVTLNHPVIIRNELVLQQGKIVSSDNATLTIAAGATVSGASETNFVDGPMLKAGNTAFVFPIGEGNVFAPLAISAPLTPGANFKAEYVHAGYPQRSIASEEIKEVSTVEHWLLNRVSGTNADSVQVSLYYYNRGRSGITDESFLRVVNYQAEGWQNLGPVVQGPNFITTARKHGSFSPLTFGSTDPINPLPVTFMSFEGRMENDKTFLAWSTASETQNKGFEVERSTNGENFVSIGFVPGAGDSHERKDYNFIDPTPPRQAYYRLKQVDHDGTSAYSETIFLRNASLQVSTLSLYPNPSAGQVTIRYETLASGETLTLTLIQADGSIVLQTHGTLPEVNQQLNEALSLLGTGFYVVQAVSIQGTARSKLIKK
jgi:hypothetical protein